MMAVLYMIIYGAINVTNDLCQNKIMAHSVCVYVILWCRYLEYEVLNDGMNDELVTIWQEVTIA
jgi:hypothetical protein